MNKQLINGPTPAPSKQVQQAPSAPIVKPSTEPAKTVTQSPQPPAPPAGKVSESTPPEKPKAKEILAAYRSCADEEKASSDPAKSKTCPKTADDKSGGSGSSAGSNSSSGNTQTGQASPGPRQKQTVVSSEIPGSVMNPVPSKPSVGTGPQVENDMSDVLNLTNTFFK